MTTLSDAPSPWVCVCLIFNDDGKLLLLQRHTTKQGGGLWAPPGGKPEPGEDAKTTIIREVSEESGLDLDAVTYLGAHEVQLSHGVVRMKTFTARVSGEPVSLSPSEHSAYKWFALDQLLTEPGVIWALPTTLRDFGLMSGFTIDPTLADGSKATLLERGTGSDVD